MNYELRIMSDEWKAESALRLADGWWLMGKTKTEGRGTIARQKMARLGRRTSKEKDWGTRDDRSPENGEAKMKDANQVKSYKQLS